MFLSNEDAIISLDEIRQDIEDVQVDLTRSRIFDDEELEKETYKKMEELLERIDISLHDTIRLLEDNCEE